VTISGGNLAGASEVSLCFVTTTFTVVSAGQLTAKVPAGACDGRWRVTTPVGTAVSDAAFTVTAAIPVVDGFTPGSGPVGSTVTISGANFTGQHGQPLLCRDDLHRRLAHPDHSPGPSRGLRRPLAHHYPHRHRRQRRRLHQH